MQLKLLEQHLVRISRIHKTVTRHTSWLHLCVPALALIWVAFILLSYDRSFWYDEVFSLGAAGINGVLDWERLKNDVHPPTFVLAIATLSDWVGSNLFALRLVNLPGVLALGLALILVRPKLDPLKFSLFVVLLFGNYLAVYMVLELRSYFLVISFSALGHVFLFRRIKGDESADIWLFLTALILTSLHLFGAAIGAAMLGISAFHHLLHRRPMRAVVVLLSAFLCIFLIFYWAFIIAYTADSLGGGLWIENSIEHYLRFISSQVLLFMTLMLAIIYQRRIPHAKGSPHLATWMLLPSIAVLGAALVVSLHTPVVTAKNLIVCVPGLVFFTVLLAPRDFLKFLNSSPFTLIVVALFVGNHARTAGADFQNISWAVTAATPEACADTPVYVINPDIVDDMAQQVFTGQITRPVRDILDLREGFDPGAYNGDCRVIAMGWHEFGKLSGIAAYFEKLNIPVTLHVAPHRVRSDESLITQGFIAEYHP